MVNHTKLIRALTLCSLSNKIKRWPSVCLKRQTDSCGYNFTVSLVFHARVGVPQGACISLTLFNFFASTFPQSDSLLTNSYDDDFTVSCSDSNIEQMAHSSNIEERTYKWCFSISAQNPTSLFSPLNSHDLIPNLKSLWTTPYYALKGLPVYWEWHQI